MILKRLLSILDIPYEIALLPIRPFDFVIRKVRHIADIFIDFIFEFLFPLRILHNVAGGCIYNFYHVTLGIPQNIIINCITLLPGWHEYGYYSWCTESRMWLPLAFLYKFFTKPLLLIPVIGWGLWIGTLPILYSLKIWEQWIRICPVRNLEAYVCPTSYGKACECRGYPSPL